jgi:hypothetical protein
MPSEGERAAVLASAVGRVSTKVSMNGAGNGAAFPNVGRLSLRFMPGRSKGGVRRAVPSAVRVPETRAEGGVTGCGAPRSSRLATFRSGCDCTSAGRNWGEAEIDDAGEVGVAPVSCAEAGRNGATPLGGEGSIPPAAMPPGMGGASDAMSNGIVEACSSLASGSIARPGTGADVPTWPPEASCRRHSSSRGDGRSVTSSRKAAVTASG